MPTNPATADHLRESILDVLAKSESALSFAQIYDLIDCAESKQQVAAQINHLKKAETIDYWQTDAGTMLYTLAVPTHVMPAADPTTGASSTVETEADSDQPSSSPLDLPDVDLHRIVWSQPSGSATRFLTLTITDDQPRLNTSGAFAIDPALLRQMADLLEVLQQKAA